MPQPSSDLRAGLDELEARLQAFGAPIAAAFRPGLEPRRVRELLSAEGLTSHPDLVTWWGWHDGVDLAVPPVTEGPGIYYRSENTLLSPWHVLGLDESLRIRRWLRDTHRDPALEQAFPASWIPILTTDGAGHLCVETVAPGPAPLHISDEGYLGGEPPQFTSINELVASILDAFDAGHVVPAPEDPRMPSLHTAELKGAQRRLAWW